MKLKELISIAKQKCSLFENYEDMEVSDLISDKSYKKVEIASGTIINEYGNKCGYIQYSANLSSLPKVGEVILMHNKYVGKVDKITYDSNYYDAVIWIKVAYFESDQNLLDELKYPTFIVINKE